MVIEAMTRNTLQIYEKDSLCVKEHKKTADGNRSDRKDSQLKLNLLDGFRVKCCNLANRYYQIRAVQMPADDFKVQTGRICNPQCSTEWCSKTGNCLGCYTGRSVTGGASTRYDDLGQNPSGSCNESPRCLMNKYLFWKSFKDRDLPFSSLSSFKEDYKGQSILSFLLYEVKEIKEYKIFTVFTSTENKILLSIRKNNLGEGSVKVNSLLLQNNNNFLFLSIEKNKKERNKCSVKTNNYLLTTT